MASDLEPVYKFPKFNEHARQRGNMWRGSSQPQRVPVWVRRGGVYQREVITASEAVLKCIDEIVVNALDHYFTWVEAPASIGGPVTRIDVSMRDDGEITISNDGPGFPVYEHEGRYIPELLMTREFSTSHFEDAKEPDRVTGGLNGVGMKVCVVSSRYFVLESYDHKRGLFYSQEIHDGANDIRAPVIATNGRDKRTSIRFLLNFSELCAGLDLPELAKWVRWRTEQAAAFISAIDYRTEGERRVAYPRRAAVFFNKQRVGFDSFAEFCEAFPALTRARYYFSLAGPKVRFPLYVCVAVSEDDDAPAVTMVNGVCLDSGSHVLVLYRKLYAAFADKISKELSGINDTACRNVLKRSLYVISACQIPLPDFVGQTKNKIKLPDSKQRALERAIEIPDDLVKSMWPALSSRIVNSVYKQRPQKKRKKQYRDLSKYQPARFAGKRSAQCRLFVPEGDSAELPVTTLIRSGVVLNSDYCGVYNIQGVPMNSLKSSRKVGDGGTLVQNKQLSKNKAFQGLVAALGLDYSCEYYCGPDPARRKEGDAQFARLNYGSLVIATDQDLDGIGQICSLILVFFLRFFPALVQRGFVQRLNTPIRRVLIGRTKYNFYSEKEYRAWLEEHGGDLPRGAKVHYYKGLGEHSEEEIVKDIATNIYKNLITFTFDDLALDAMRKMYGISAAERKLILMTPCTQDYSAEYEHQRVTCSEHFGIESKAFQLNFLIRKLKSAIDGLVESQRKAFAGARRYFKEKRAITKVYQLTGHVAKTMHYVHGDQCMNDTIIRMAQCFTGANNIPVFLPISQGFGTRVKGRSKHSSPRYLDIGYNPVMDIIFPREDDALLQYVYDDGERCEPRFYVPIVPYAILETATTTSAGWNINVWARDFRQVMTRLRRMINTDPDREGEIPDPGILNGHPWLKEGMSVQLVPRGGAFMEICLGSHFYDARRNTLVITQLPLRVWSFTVQCAALGFNPRTNEERPSPYVKDCADKTAKDRVYIEIKFKPEGYDALCKDYGNELLDPAQDAFGLYTEMRAGLNMVVKDGFVREFPSYSEVMRYWYGFRRDLYKLRLRRQLILAELRVLYYENVSRFLSEFMSGSIDISRRPLEERVAILSSHGYQRFRADVLFSPGLEPVDTLRERILGGDYGYIDRLKVGDTERGKLAKLAGKLEAAREHLARLRKRTWKDMWLEELDALDARFAEGERTQWQFSNCGFTYK